MTDVRDRGLDFAKGGGLVPVAVQDFTTRRILMLAYADEKAVEMTLSTGFAHYYSRTRKELWKKGETSGHVQRVREILADCDLDSLVYIVDQTGPACHTGRETCFFTRLDEKATSSYDLSMMAKAIALAEGGTVTTRRWVRDDSRREYRYLVNPLTEAVPPPSAEMMEWLAGVMERMAPSEVDKIVTFEALGIPYSLLLAQRRKLPLVIVRKRDFYAPEHQFAKVRYRSGFERGTYYVYDLSPGDRVLVIDDMVSTGGTLVPTLKELRAKGVLVQKAICVGEKPQYGGLKAVREAGFTVDALFSLTQEKGRIRVEPTRALLDSISGKPSPKAKGKGRRRGADQLHNR